MASTPRQTNVITAAVITFADTEAELETATLTYDCVTTGAGFTASANLTDVPATGCAPASQVAAASSWMLDIAWLQDWQSPGGGLSGYMYENDSLRKWVKVEPTTPGLPAATAEVTIVAGTYAGTFGELLVATSSCPTVGKPEIALPAAAMAETTASTSTASTSTSTSATTSAA